MAYSTKLQSSFAFDEVRKHNVSDDAWMVIDDKIYDITTWQYRHPGGRIISYYKGHDATDIVHSLHADQQLLKKYMHPLYIGTIQRPFAASLVIQDFRTLRSRLLQDGYFESQKLFYALQLIQIVLLEIIASWLLYRYYGSISAFAIAVILLGTSQIQAGCSQHDYSHNSVFKYKKHDELVENFLVGVIQGASVHWWKRRHIYHHAKIRPSDDTWALYIFGESIAKLKMGWRRTRYRNVYWWIYGPPLATTPLFLLQIGYYIVSNKCWNDLFWYFGHILRWTIFLSWMPFWQVFSLYSGAKFLSTLWFAFVTSFSHLPDHPGLESENWVVAQVASTQNIDDNFFNNWFTGHVNFQIEHHLFPTMPRHNYSRISPLIRDLCKKHGIEYRVTSLSGAIIEVIQAVLEAASLFIQSQI